MTEAKTFYRDLVLPDGFLFASAKELEEATDERRRQIFEDYREACREYCRA